jgi:arginine-tRNA-protein transferase
MNYKSRFLPQQRLAPSGWLRFDSDVSSALAEAQD